MKARWLGGMLVSILVLGSCSTGSEPEVPITTTPPVTTTPTTDAPTTSLSVSISERLVEILGDPAFSAHIEIDSLHRQRGFEDRSQGEGDISGADSRILIEWDYADLATTFIDTEGRLLGPGGLATGSEESRLVGGTLYETKDGGPWRWLGENGNTSVGHVFDRLAQLPEFEDLGEEVLDGAQLHHLRPLALPEFDPTYWGWDLSALEEVLSLADVYTDDTGTPVRIDMQLGAGHRIVGPLVLTETYRLSRVGEANVIDRPTDVRRSLSSHGFNSFVDVSLPDSWSVVQHESGFTELTSPEGHYLAIEVSLWDEEIDADSAFQALLSEIGESANSVEAMETSLFPSRYGEIGSEGSLAAYIELRPLGATLGDRWAARALLKMVWEFEPVDGFQDIIETVTWGPPGALVSDAPEAAVPGETLVDHIVQADTLAVLIPFIRSDTGCEEPAVVYTVPVAGAEESWVENWYVSVCGELLVYPIEFSVMADRIAIEGFAPSPVDP